MQQHALLATKLYIPPIRPELVSRPRLLERLNAGLPTRGDLSRSGDAFPRALTLVTAPAGFGKTTLVSEWVQAMSGATPPIAVAWLSLDEGDNDPTRFLAYLIAALRTIEANMGKGMLSALQSPQPPPTEDILIFLINEVAALPDRMIIVLDDHHLIEAQAIHDALTFLLEHLPPQLHLVIASREDPPLLLARLRARGQLTEVRATDLRFTSSESAEFLNQMMCLGLSAEDIDVLEARTEGWIAGLQLAALALQGPSSLQGRKDASNLIRSFTGSHRFVLDYLVQEVLEQQSESVQTFLLQTAILDRLTGSLCDALTGEDNGHAILEVLERANLFIVPLDEERRWYRYHHLFADLLHQRLRQTQPEQVLTLHQRASAWYEQKGFVDEAIEHALRAEAFEAAANLIEEHVDALWQRGQHTKLQRWLAGLPAELLCSKPHLCILHAWNLFLSGQQDAAEQCLQAAERALDAGSDAATEASPLERDPLPSSEVSKIQGRAAAIRAFLAFYRGDAQETRKYARHALESLPEQDMAWRSSANVALGDAHSIAGDLAAAYRVRSEALEASKAAGNIYIVLIASMKLAITLRQQGRLEQVIEMCQHHLRLANEHGLSQTVLVGGLLAIWGETLVELNDLDGAIGQAKKGTKLTRRGGDVAMIGWSYLCLIRVLFSRGELAGAEETMREMEDIARETFVPPWVADQAAAWQVRIWLARDKLDAASQWVEQRGLNTDGESMPLHELDYYLRFEYIMLARVLIAQGRLDQATGLLKRLLEAAEAGGRKTRVIELLLLQTLATDAGSDATQAMATLERALTLAEPEGFIRIFVDEGPPMARLLYEALSREIAPDYVRRLLAAFPGAEPEQAERARAQAPESELVEPLSEREIEVLQLMAEGLINREIASRLFLSLNTVKAHTRNIYGKLGVHNRTQAVTRARALAILPSI